MGEVMNVVADGAWATMLFLFGTYTKIIVSSVVITGLALAGVAYGMNADERQVRKAQKARRARSHRRR